MNCTIKSILGNHQQFISWKQIFPFQCWLTLSCNFMNNTSTTNFTLTINLQKLLANCENKNKNKEERLINSN